VIAELAAFNAGFQVIKTFVANGRDLSDAAGAIGKMVGAKEDLKRRQNKQKKSVMSFLGGKRESDFEEFMALEKIIELEKEMVSMMRLYGRPGLYDDWVRFQAEARKKRRDEETAAKKKRSKQIEFLAWILGLIIIAAGLVGLMLWVVWLKG
jgi:hypothetical protein|tara:strand:+ start:367 stop:822 length:456 start_codon:yes stop_codon:yes gene_type:complete